MGYIFLQQGYYEAAAHNLSLCLELAQGKEQLLAHLPMYEGFRAEITLHSGEGEKALTQVQAALLRAEQSRQPVAKAQVQQSMSRILAAGDNPDGGQIESLLNNSIAFHESGPALPPAAIAKFELGKVYAQQGLKEQSLFMFDQAFRQFKTLRMTWHLAQAGDVSAQSGGEVI